MIIIFSRAHRARAKKRVIVVLLIVLDGGVGADVEGSQFIPGTSGAVDDAKTVQLNEIVLLDQGDLASVACSSCMYCLWAARLARSHWYVPCVTLRQHCRN